MLLYATIAPSIVNYFCSESALKRPTLREMSNYAFSANLLFANLMRIPVLGNILRIPVGVLWLIAFGTWYLDSFIEGKSHPHQTNGWYAFAEFKAQNEIAALVGVAAAILMLVVPELIVPIAWLFLISNVFWAIATHHESQVLHTDDDTYSTDKQIIYSYLALAVTILSLVTAIGATITVYLPFIAPAIFPILTGIGIGLALVSAGMGLTWVFGTYETDKNKKMQLDLENSPTNPLILGNITCHEPTPINYPSPIHSTKKSAIPEDNNEHIKWYETCGANQL